MTRERATQIFKNINPGCDDCDQTIETFVALGMLKLGDPMSGQQKAFDILCAHVEEITAKDIIREMVLANLEITEQQER